MAYPGWHLANIWPGEGMILTGLRICVFVDTTSKIAFTEVINQQKNKKIYTFEKYLARAKH